MLGSGFQMFFRSNNVSLKTCVGCSTEGQMGPGAVQWVCVLAEGKVTRHVRGGSLHVRGLFTAVC